MERREIEVRYVNCPDMEDKRIGFCGILVKPVIAWYHATPTAIQVEEVIGFCHIENHSLLESLAS